MTTILAVGAARRHAGIAGLVGVLAIAPARTQVTPPTERAVQELAGRLDAAFSEGDAARYFTPFEPLHPALQRVVEDRVRRVFAEGARLERVSKIERFWVLGHHGIALVRSETSNPSHPDREAVRDDALWAVRGPDGDPRIVLAVDVDARTLADLPDPESPLMPKRDFRCRACNYSIHAGDDWLMVPTCGSRTGSLESFSFYSLSHDLSAYLSVHLVRAAEVPAPDAMLRLLIGRVLPVDPSTLEVEPWLPPMYTPDTRPVYLSGARAVVEVGATRDEVHLATYGRLGYLMVVRGSEPDAGRNRDAIDTLMRSFALQDPHLAPELVEARITRDMQGGELEGSVYTNHRYGLRFEGPSGWRGLMAGNGYAFDVTWQRADGGAFLRLKALKPPEGVTRWTTSMAESTLRNACLRPGIRIESDSGWTAGTNGFGRQRGIEILGATADAERTIVRVSLDDDLLVVLEAHARDDDGVRDVRAVLDNASRAR